MRVGYIFNNSVDHDRQVVFEQDTKPGSEKLQMWGYL